MKKILILSMMVGFVALLAGLWTAPASADIVNGGFEINDFTGWTTSGQTAITNAGFDVRTFDVLPMVGAGAHSAKVGDENAFGFTGDFQSSISQTFKVGATFSKLYFAWAAVGLVPNNGVDHTLTQTPWFQVKVDDLTAAINLKTEEFFTGNLGAINLGWFAGATQTGPGVLGQDDAGIWYYRPWETYSLDVSGLADHNLTVTLTTRDCELDGHASYAYLDGFGDTAPVTNPVPEPATMLLLGSGLVGLAGFARRRFKK